MQTCCSKSREACLELLLPLKIVLSLDSSSLLSKGSSFCLSFCCNALSFCNSGCYLWRQLLTKSRRSIIVHDIGKINGTSNINIASNVDDGSDSSKSSASEGSVSAVGSCIG